MTYGHEPSKLENRLYIAGAILIGLLLFVVLSQPVWNSKRMISDFKARCDAQHGVQYVHHGMFGDTYECLPLLDKGIKQ